VLLIMGLLITAIILLASFLGAALITQSGEE